MPKAPPRAKKHKHKAKQRKTTERGLGWDWQQFRKHVLADEGCYCKRCWEVDGRVVEAEELHHVIPRRVDMTKRLDRDNVRPLCRACHNIEDAEGND